MYFTKRKVFVLTSSEEEGGPSKTVEKGFSRNQLHKKRHSDGVSFLLASLARFERAAFRLGGERSILLSYRDIANIFYFFGGVLSTGYYFSGRSINIFMVRKISPHLLHFHSVSLFFAFLWRCSRNSCPHFGQGTFSFVQSFFKKATSSSRVLKYIFFSFTKSAFRSAQLPEDLRLHSGA